MQFAEIAEIVKGIPYTQIERGRLIYDHILKHRPKNCLELGFAHGVASCYIAAALDEVGEGHLDCCDLEESSERDPNLEQLLDRAGLSKYVSVHREMNSYTWFLKKKIEQQTNENNCQSCYDFCFIDGPKNWTIDGFAFFLCDKLLRENGYILFDDFRWKYSDYSKDSVDGISKRGISQDQLDDANIETVFRLCVMQHPNYSGFEIDDDWAWAHKVRSDEKTVRIVSTLSFKYRVLKKLKSLLGRA